MDGLSSALYALIPMSRMPDPGRVWGWRGEAIIWQGIGPGDQ